jgi:glycosyl transferase family 25
MVKNISDIKNVFYINLDSRLDRKQNVINELNKIGLTGTRFNAIKNQIGAIGCTMSHLEILKMAQKEDMDHVLIVEDDISFLKPLLFVSQLNKFLSAKDNWDVVLLAGNVLRYAKQDDICIRVGKSLTTTGYLVRKKYYQPLINNIEEGLYKLMIEPHKGISFAIDQYWARLQMIDNWFLIIPLTVTQIVSYSNIEKKITNYSGGMLQLDNKNAQKHKLRKLIIV